MSERRTALVTGGAKRVGREIVIRLAEAGWNVVFTYYSSSEEARLLEGRDADNVIDPQRIVSVGADLTELDIFEPAIIHAVEAIGRLDLLVNSASLYQPDPDRFSPRLFEQTFKLNVEAPMRLTDTFSLMLRASRGHVINMIDILAERPWPKYRTYCASKAALANATLSLARQLAPEVTVNGIAPGVVDWPDDMPEAARNEYLEKVPLRRAGTPRDVANLVHFLVTEGTYINGEIIRLDGGRGIA